MRDFSLGVRCSLVFEDQSRCEAQKDSGLPLFLAPRHILPAFLKHLSDASIDVSRILSFTHMGLDSDFVSQNTGSHSLTTIATLL